MDQGPGQDLTGSSTSHLSQAVSSETGVSGQGLMEKGPMEEGRTSRLTHMDIGRIQLLVGYCTEGLRPSLAVGQTVPPAPCHETLSIRPRMQEEPEREKECQRGASHSLGTVELQN